jgi:hypothetical protein
VLFLKAFAKWYAPLLLILFRVRFNVVSIYIQYDDEIDTTSKNWSYSIIV